VLAGRASQDLDGKLKSRDSSGRFNMGYGHPKAKLNHCAKCLPPCWARCAVDTRGQGQGKGDALLGSGVESMVGCWPQLESAKHAVPCRSSSWVAAIT